jgi:hypothetical protein
MAIRITAQNVIDVYNAAKSQIVMSLSGHVNQITWLQVYRKYAIIWADGY